MPTYHPISQSQEEYFKRSGALLILKYGAILDGLGRDPFRRSSNDQKQRHDWLGQVREAQVELEFFFEVENRNAILKKYLLGTDGKLSIPITNIMSYLAHHLVHEGEELVCIGSMLKTLSDADCRRSVLEYRRVVHTLIIEREGILKAVDDRDSAGVNIRIGFGSTSPFLVDMFEKNSIPFLTTETIAHLRAAKNAKSRSKGAPIVTESADILPVLSAKEIERRLQEHVVGQSEVIRSLSVRLALHLRKARMILAGEHVTAPNEVVLMIGSPSVGKSLIANSIPKALDDQKRFVDPYVLEPVSAPDADKRGFEENKKLLELCKEGRFLEWANTNSVKEG